MLVLLSITSVAQTQDGGVPHLVLEEEHAGLLVDGSPYLILGGQARNSSASNLQDVEVVYRALDAMHANTAEIPLSWNLLESKPGQFDFHLVDGAIEGARRHHLKLVYL